MRLARCSVVGACSSSDSTFVVDSLHLSHKDLDLGIRNHCSAKAKAYCETYCEKAIDIQHYSYEDYRLRCQTGAPCLQAALELKEGHIL